jgi:hypothetical protein
MSDVLLWRRLVRTHQLAGLPCHARYHSLSVFARCDGGWIVQERGVEGALLAADLYFARNGP